jgi:hypothetical protein
MSTPSGIRSALSLLLFAAFALLPLLTVTPKAGAQAVVYYDESAFRALLSSYSQIPTTISFNGLAPDAPPYYTGVENTYTTQGVTFHSNGSAINITSPLYFSGDGYDYHTGDTINIFHDSKQPEEETAAAFTVTLLPNTDAVGLDIGNFTGDPVTIQLSDGEKFQVKAGKPFSLGGTGFNFVGFACPYPITSFTLRPESKTYGPAYDDFIYAIPSTPARSQ